MVMKKWMEFFCLWNFSSNSILITVENLEKRRISNVFLLRYFQSKMPSGKFFLYSFRLDLCSLTNHFHLYRLDSLDIDFYMLFFDCKR